MSTYSRPLSLSASIAAMLCCHTSLAQENASDARDRVEAEGEATDDAVADEIVVTATRRETSLQDVAQSIAVLDGADQRLTGQQRLQDIQLAVPNVTFTTTSNSSQLFIRGVGNTFINAGGDPGVAFYQDGTYVSDSRSINTSLFDIERTEILRGPQGALYGRNAVGGAVNVISARPTAETAGRIDVVVGDYGRFESQGFLSGSLMDGVRGRLSYQHKQLDGYVENLAEGPDRFDDADIQSVRAQLEFDVSQGGTVNLLASHYTQSDNGPALAVVSRPGFIYPTEALFGLTPTDEPREVQATIGSNDLDVSVLHARWEQPIEEMTLSVLGNYRKSEQDFLNDCDGTTGDGCEYSTETESNDYYLEAYLASADDAAFTWLVGANYVALDQTQDILVPWLTLAAYFDPSLPTDIPFPITYNGGGDLTSDSWAIYGDVRYELSDVIALTGQLRYTETTKRSDEFQTIPEFGVDVASFENEVENDFLPFKLGLEARAAPDVLFYASYATANKDGAINIGALQSATVAPEEVRTWEVGEKAEFLDGQLQLNSAIFYSEYTDLQIAQVVGTVATLTNAPEASIFGLEVDAVLEPSEGFELRLSGGYLDATIDEFSNGRTIPGPVSGPLTDLSGNQLPYVPEFSATANARYDKQVTNDMTASVGAQVAWRSRVYFNEFNIDENSQAGGAVVNLSGSLTRADGLQAFAYVNNVFDRTYELGSTIYSGLLGAEKAVSYAPPRHVGVGVAYQF